MRIDKCKMKGVTLPNLHFAFSISHFNFFNDSLRVGKGTQDIVPPSPNFQHFDSPTGRLSLGLVAAGAVERPQPPDEILAVDSGHVCSAELAQ